MSSADPIAADVLDRIGTALAVSCMVGRLSHLDEPAKAEMVNLGIVLHELAEAFREPARPPRPLCLAWWRRWFGVNVEPT